VVGEEGDGGRDEVSFGSRGEEVERDSSTELGLEEFEELELSDNGLSDKLGITGRGKGRGGQGGQLDEFEEVEGPVDASREKLDAKTDSRRD